MALYITSLNSGSNGNCYYVGNGTDAVLVDVGISCRETEKRMKHLGLPMKTIKAIFVSHEHGDHIKGVSVLANKYKLPVYMTDATSSNGPILIKHLRKTFIADEPVTIGQLKVTPFAKQHDAIDPHSFVISFNNITVGVFTDIGIVCSNLIKYFKQCHAAFLEANYDETMLENGKYPLHLKKRIRGDQGHLSNNQALELFLTHRSDYLSYLILSHLSKENNSPRLVQDLFEQNTLNTKVIIASRYEASSVYTINSDKTDSIVEKAIYVRPTQLDLFKA
jgi:phosphoribosyl 1,2-cyclic phosphodiesterase